METYGQGLSRGIKMSYIEDECLKEYIIVIKVKLLVAATPLPLYFAQFPILDVAEQKRVRRIGNDIALLSHDFHILNFISVCGLKSEPLLRVNA